VRLGVYATAVLTLTFRSIDRTSSSLESPSAWQRPPWRYNRRDVTRQADKLPDWERLPGAERHLQARVPVHAGGMADALHAGHRRSMDGGHVIEDLRERVDEVLAALEAAAGWQTTRVRKPLAILGRLDGVMTGIRQLRRMRPLGTETVAGLRVPTLAEMARVEAWLLATRYTVGDSLAESDTVVLLERLGEPGAVAALGSFDEIYLQPNGAPLSSRWLIGWPTRLCADASPLSSDGCPCPIPVSGSQRWPAWASRSTGRPLCLPILASPEASTCGLYPAPSTTAARRPQLSSLIRASFSISGSGLRLVTSMRIPVPSG
jgi:hypothetical protein